MTGNPLIQHRSITEFLYPHSEKHGDFDNRGAMASIAESMGHTEPLYRLCQPNYQRGFGRLFP